jgi:cytidylate kinase
MPELTKPQQTMGDEVQLRRATERVIGEAAIDNSVVVGRAGAIVLRGHDDALHVRLDGPRKSRIVQGAQALGLSLKEAEKRLDQTDRARAAYVRELYSRDWRDPDLYHLMINSTVLSTEVCARLILAAAKARFSVSFQ